jgi:hypothetical protein
MTPGPGRSFGASCREGLLGALPGVLLLARLRRRSRGRRLDWSDPCFPVPESEGGSIDQPLILWHCCFNLQEILNSVRSLRRSNRVAGLDDSTTTSTTRSRTYGGTGRTTVWYLCRTNRTELRAENSCTNIPRTPIRDTSIQVTRLDLLIWYLGVYE